MHRRVFPYLAIASCLLIAPGVRAHHSYSEYDDQRIVEIEGQLVRVAMQNPHVHFFVEGVGADGRAITWDLETLSLNWLRRTKIPPELLKIGSQVRFAGWPSRRSPARIYSLNLLAADGQEVLLFRTAKLRWRETALGYASAEAQAFYEDGVASDTVTLFRVWASNQGDLASAFRPTAPLALTDAAARAVAAFDPVNDSTEKGCTPKGMPRLMSQPPPMQFIDRGDTLVLRMEEYDTLRTIHMTSAATPATQPRTPLGYSVGRWDDKTLVVETTRVNAPYLTAAGVPLGARARFVEQFTPTADGSRLDYRLTITDPDSLTAPAVYTRSWVSRPGEEVLPFECVE